MTTGKDAAQVQSVPAVGNLDSALSRITRTASENTAKSAQMASEQRDWQERQMPWLCNSTLRRPLKAVLGRNI